MDQNFCRHYKGDCHPPTTRYCRDCPEAETACNRLWQAIVDLSNSKNRDAGILPDTHSIMYPNQENWDIVHLKINVN